MKKVLMGLMVAVAVSFSGVAHAIDLDQRVKDIDGKELIGADGKPLDLTLAKAITNALLSEQTNNEKDKGENFRLATTIVANSKNYSPAAEDVIRIKKAVGDTQATLVYGQVVKVLDAAFAQSLESPKK